MRKIILTLTSLIIFVSFLYTDQLTGKVTDSQSGQ
jgi:hypothetical protein